MLYVVGCPACSAPALSSELICRHCGHDLTVPYKRLDHVRQRIKRGRGKWRRDRRRRRSGHRTH
jgi:hypothetical protein